MVPFNRVERVKGTMASRVARERPKPPRLVFVAERKFDSREEVETFFGFERGGRAAQQGSRFVLVVGRGKREGGEDGFVGGHVVSPDP